MIYIGTWNIMTMLKAGKMNEIADEMLKTQLQGITVTNILLQPLSLPMC